MSLMENQKVENWLCESRTASTRRSYELRIAKFFSWYKGSVEDFLALNPKEKRTILLRFQNTHLDQNHNTINAHVAAILSFLRSADLPLSLKGKTLRPVMDLTSHTFTNGNLKQMFEVGNLKEKALLALATSLGWEVGAVLDLKRCFLESMIAKAKSEKEEFAYFLSQREKTGAVRLGVLNPLALEWVDKFLIESGKRLKRKRLDAPKRDYGVSDVFDVNHSGANRIIMRLAKKAGIITTGRVHFHKIRAWVMSGLSRAGFNEFQIKFLIGKTIPASDLTYLETLKQEIEERYPAAYEHCLNIKTPIKAVLDLAKSLEQKSLEVEDVKKAMEALKQEYASKFKTLETEKTGVTDLKNRLTEIENQILPSWKLLQEIIAKTKKENSPEKTDL